MASHHHHMRHAKKIEIVKPLTELCVRCIASNFRERPDLASVPDKYAKRVIALLPTDLPLEITAPLIDDESYWKRSATERWSNCQPAEHGDSWKRLYIEKHLSEELEKFDPATHSFDELRRTVDISKAYARTLTVRELPSHMDIGFVLQHAPNFETLCLTCGARRVGMDYERSLFGMKLADATALAKALRSFATNVRTLKLPMNLLDDDRLRLLVTGLMNNDTVTHIDLSHNKVADRGVRALARLLGERSSIRILDLCDNEVHAEGGKAFGRALVKNTSLTYLNLRLNRLGEDGGRMIAEGLRNNKSLHTLNLSSNALGPVAAKSFGHTFRLNASLTNLDLSCNQIGEEGGRHLKEGLDENQGVQVMDLRMNGLGAQAETAIAELLKRTEKKAKRAAQKYQTQQAMSASQDFAQDS
eukprot:Rmarinus@m.26819